MTRTAIVTGAARGIGRAIAARPVLDINLSGAFFCGQAVVRQMVARALR